MVPITDKEFQIFSSYIKSNYGISLKDEKRTLLTGRLHQVLAQHKLNNFTEYFDYVVSDKTGAAALTLVDKITTNHTFFMREIDHFNYFKNTVLPYLASHVGERDLRIWSAGCSSGEEPYTLAMIMGDFFVNKKLWWDTKILATDISSKVLNTAIKGEYANARLTLLPDHWKKHYFRQVNSEKSALIKKMKDEVIYRKFNLMESFPFKKKFHVIFCRNVMIYFDHKTKNELVKKFYDFTEKGGYLFIGQSEALNRQEIKYKYVMPAVYRKE